VNLSRGTERAPIVVDRREKAEIALAREIVELVKERRRVVLGLATGGTPAGVYRELARLRAAERVDFGAVETFVLDEYLDLAPDHPQTFARWLRERVHAPLGIALERTRGIPIPTSGIEKACADYERAIRDAGGIDLQILGIGRNGHIAFNEPGSERASRTREVELHPWTREDAASAFGGLDAVPRRAITMGVATILEARKLRALAFGSRKKEIVQRTLEEPIGPAVPATFVREHRDLVFWIDREAAGR
jgi:glucosamine-6-phosphate deaminase